MLTVENISVIYPDKTKAVDGVSFSVGSYENVALLGENGAGKTTLMRAIMGMVNTAGGTVKVDGFTTNKKVGFVFQNPDKQFSMPENYNESRTKLSGGEKRMLAIAAVLSMRPSFLMFDEPTTFLDLSARRLLIAALKKLEHPKIIATHDLAFASEICNRVIVLKDGRVAADGDLSILKDEEFLHECGL